MSSTKRRKLEDHSQPQSPVSAVSAVAARRRQGASATQTQNSPPAEQSESLTPTANSFSALQKLRSSGETLKSPRKAPQQNAQRRTEGNRAIRAEACKTTSQSLDSRNKPTDQTLTTPTTTHQPVNYSSFRLTKSNHRTITSNVIELTLDEGERFVILGSFGIRVKSGEVTLVGATLQVSDSIYWVQAPHCLALPVIRTTKDSQIELHHDPNLDNLRKLGRLSPLLRRIWNEPSETVDKTDVFRRSFQIIGTTSDAPKRCVIQELASPPEWNKKLASLVPAAARNRRWSAFICGPKSSGKSTFLRLLINRLLTSSPDGQATTKRVAVIDLDPGQPEYAPSGTVSLISVQRPNFGAPFTHTNFDDYTHTVFRCHSLASVTPASAPDLFVDCAVDLYETYQRSLRNCPLVINTPGWILGTGLDLLVELLRRIRPSETVYMSEEGPADVVDVLKDTSKDTFDALPSQPSEFMSRTAAHFRSMQMISYFHSQVLQSDKLTNDSRRGWSTQPLTSVRPYVVRYHGNSCGILGVMSYNYQPPKEMLASSIDGSILAIVEIEDQSAFQRLKSPSSQQSESDGAKDAEAPRIIVSRTDDGLPFIANPDDATLDPRYCRTIGLALVRGIDIKRRCLQLITPVPLLELEHIRSQGKDIILLHGQFDTPQWAYTEELYNKSTQEESMDNELQITDEGTSDDEAQDEAEKAGRTAKENETSAVPWVEVLNGNEKRPVGSRVWRVRRDLGRSNSE